MQEVKINYLTSKNKGNKTYKFEERKEIVEDQAQSIATQDRLELVKTSLLMLP